MASRSTHLPSCGAATPDGALRGGPPGRFTLRGVIAALHATAPAYAGTDRPRILVLYDELLRAWPSPVVALNRAVAAALAEVDALDLAGYRYLPAVRADLRHRPGRAGEAAAEYERAAALAGNDVERALLLSRTSRPAPSRGG